MPVMPPPPDLQVLVDRPGLHVVGGARRSRSVDVGAYVAAAGAPLRLRARRRGRHIAIEQLLGEGSGSVARPTALRATSFPRGISSFVELEVRDARGRTVARSRRDVCPNSFGFRVDELDPATPRLPSFAMSCGHVLSTEVAWGIDRGWAIPLAVSAAGRLPVGRLTATVTVDPDRRLADADRGNNTVRVPIRSTSEAPRRPRAAARAAARAPYAAADLPNLRALPAAEISLRGSPRREQLRFGAVVWNAGPAPLVVEGRAVRATPPKMLAYQRVGLQHPRVGRMVFNARDGHDHWHYAHLARYRLLDRHHRPVRAARSAKIGWCFLGTDPIDQGVPGAAIAPSVDLFGTCGQRFSRSVRLDLQPGWGDHYSAELPGQALSTERVPAGTYFVEITANPDDRLLEGDRTDNRSLRRVVIGPGRAGRRSVRVPAWRGVETERDADVEAELPFGPKL